MKFDLKISAINFLLFFTGFFLRLSVDDGTFTPTILGFGVSLAGAFFAIFILNKIGMFSKKQELSPEIEKYLPKLRAVKAIQIGMWILLIFHYFSFKTIYEPILPLGVVILIMFAPVVVVFAVPGYVAYKYEVFYSGIFHAGGKYSQGKEAKDKGSLLLIISGIILFGVLFLFTLDLLEMLA